MTNLGIPQELPFAARHIGPTDDEQAKMLAVLGYGSLTDLTDAAIPAGIRSQRRLRLPDPATEDEVIGELRRIADQNQVQTSMIGLGYYDTVTPAVIRRNVLESPAWYTAYTPYQPEISQGRLEALLNFQTVVEDLTGLPIAGASLLDEATAAAEAMALARRSVRSGGSTFLVDAEVLPQTIAVLQTRARPLGIEVVVADLSDGLPEGDFFAALLQFPGTSGNVRDDAALIESIHAAGALAVVAADLLALTLLRAPGEIGADIAVGSAQRFGVPMGFGGPHAGFMAVRQPLARSLPGRLVGVSKDATGQPAYRLALQTREQHIRREKATSNICTAQVLLAVIASMYAVYHGPEGLRAIARRVHGHAVRLADALRGAGLHVVHQHFFDTVVVQVPGRAQQILENAEHRGVNLWLVDQDHLSIACDEKTDAGTIARVCAAFGASPDDALSEDETQVAFPADLVRTTGFLTHPVFHQHHSETAMLRYLRRLSDRDYALDRGMIPLGSCTMKLNATTEMEPISWPEFANIHPFAPMHQTTGYQRVVRDLEAWLAELTGYAAVSLQPNAGSQGEFAGLLAISSYHGARGEEQRKVCLIPSSAHGTNAASAVMAGMRVVVVACDENGNVDVAKLTETVAKHRDELAAIMLTYPSTHGVFEESVREVCDLVHEAGGQVYIDGANLNALVGLARPGEFGADVSHLNLHKTFCIPHGGGGPGVGPIGVREHLAGYLPDHPLAPDAGPVTGAGPVSAAPWGSAGILPISWTYLRLMGADGLRRATGVAVLAANYVASRLAPHFPVLYTGRNSLVAHECIVDLRNITSATGITVDDVAKRLIDYGFHAPTMSFPVAGTLMIEPTESENLAELDRFIAAMIHIRGEIEKVASGDYDRADNPLKGAPHPATALVEEWSHAYSRAEAVYPTPAVRQDKYWSPVGRIDSAYGDRNLVCSCPPIAAYES